MMTCYYLVLPLKGCLELSISFVLILNVLFYQGFALRVRVKEMPSLAKPFGAMAKSKTSSFHRILCCRQQYKVRRTHAC